MIQLQARLHPVEAVELEESETPRIVGCFIGYVADGCGCHFGEVLGDGGGRRGVREVA